MKAVIMAGGEGTRLRPLTCDIPKPMLPLLNRPTIEYIIELLKKHGITDIAVTLQYLPEQIEEYFEDGQKWGVNLRYFREETPLGTAGSVKNTGDFLNETFVVISGDALTDINITDAIAFHKARNADVTIITKHVEVPLEYGIVITDENDKIVRFLEKPTWGEVFSDAVNTGIYIIEPEVMGYIKPLDKFDFSKDLFPLLMNQNKSLYAYETNNYWCDIGDLKQYIEAHQDMLNQLVNVRIHAKEKEHGVFIEDDVFIDENALITGPCYIGKNSHIMRDVHIDSYSVIGDNCRIHENTSVKRTILFNNCHIGEQSALRGCVLCRNVTIGKGLAIYEQAVVGKNCTIGAKAVVQPGVKLWPNKTISPGTTVREHLVWAKNNARAIFQNDGIIGDFFAQMTPEFCSTLACAYASAYAKKGKIGISFEDHPQTHLLADAVEIGLLSMGCDVWRFGICTLPMLRFGITNLQLAGGIHIRKQEGDMIQIELLDNQGLVIDSSLERKIDNLLERQDFHKFEGGIIGKVVEIENVMDFYQAYICTKADHRLFQNKCIRISIDCKDYKIQDFFARTLQNLGMEVDFSFQLSGDYEKEFIQRRAWQEKEILFGILFSPSGDILAIYDENGKQLEDMRRMTLMYFLFANRTYPTKISVPLNMPSVIEEIFKKYDKESIRVRINQRAVMEAQICADNGNLQFAHARMDGLMCTIWLLEQLLKEEKSLSWLQRQIPDFFIAERSIACAFFEKGKIMRHIVDGEKKEDMQLLEGVRVQRDGGWVLVIPDKQAPCCRVVSEGFCEEYADELADFYADKVRKACKET